MKKTSAGILVYRLSNPLIEVLLVHPGGPFWAKKDIGAWSVPKGELETGEDPLQAAIREVQEETGIQLNGDFLPLKPIRLSSGKIIRVWAIEKQVDTTKIVSNLFEMEWPPCSGNRMQFPEVDKAQWFTIAEAKQKMNKGQVPLLTELCLLLSGA